ncbi:MAG: sigma-54 dependent transcriptional regulator [Pirellulaceae bacterium]|jgi:DNA-binding NtrC family response regulator|nr:sigma-54 dependent transcriptional regulator [Pirellulaceae bacterium]
MSRKILVLANETATAQHYQRLLGAGGHDVQSDELGSAEVAAAVAGGIDVAFIILTAAELEPVDILHQLKAVDSTLRVVVVSRNETVQAAVEAMREGAADYLHEPCSAEELQAALRRLEPTLSAVTTTGSAGGESRGTRSFEGMLGQCSAMREVFALIERIAPADATVLVTGESGTGKEMAVRAIHRLSRRRDNPFLGCDCTALAPTLLESELFGHVKGSFSGAIATKKGLFEAAHQGTLLLDEVSNLSMETQGKLLRVLETRQIRKVGDTAEREVDIRLIATTNRSLGEMVKVGTFRADLYYRLNVVPITLPPLRERNGDIPLLANVFLEHFSRQMELELKGFSPEAMRQMEVYPWPGNVRELRNIVERLAVLYGGTRIEHHHLPVEVREAKCTISTAELPRTWDEFKNLKRQIIDDLECRFLIAALERCSQNVTHAAESVGMQRPNFHALLRHHRLKPGISGHP